MSLSWSELQPLRPAVDGGGWERYVDPPHQLGKKLAQRLEVGGQRIALWGPVGSGKSTELRATARLASSALLTVLIPLDVDLDLRHVPEPWELSKALSAATAKAAEEADIVLSPPLTERLTRAGVMPRRGTRLQPSASPSPELTREVLAEVARRRPVALLVDGVEKPSPAIARETLRLIVSVTQGTTLLAVLSPAIVTGPEAYEVLEDLGLRQAPLRPVLVDPALGAGAEAGQAFLREIALRRLGADAKNTIAELLDRAALLSGGVPRTFLQLLRDSHTAAALALRELPDESDFAEAARDHRSSLRRLLRDGDLEVLRRSRGTSGIEIPVERRTRLLAQGLLLEYELPDLPDPIVQPHPLLGVD